MTPLDAMLAHSDVARLARSLSANPGVELVPGSPAQWAAVAVIMRAIPGAEPEMLMIKRAERTGDPWSGHVACPGGRRDPGDRDLWHTATRETWEETGIELERDGRLLGALDDLKPRSPLLPPLVIRPFVAVVRPDVEIVASDEVAEAFWVPLPTLRERAAWGTGLVEIRGLGPREEPVFRHGPHMVWGLTERVLRELVARIEGEWERPD